MFSQTYSSVVTADAVASLADEPLRALCGGKGLGLVRMAQAGLNVPQFVIFTADGLTDLYEKRWGPLSKSMNKPELVSRIGSLAGPELGELVKQSLSILGHAPKAVRSSAATEDGRLSSAGQLESFLNVDDHQIESAILKVFASSFGAKATAYARVNGFAPSVPAVIVQNMVPAQIAGVVFSMHPVSGERKPVISIVDGLADKLVSGRIDGRTTFLSESELSDIHRAYLTKCLGQCEKLFGGPQDIEFAADKERIYLVQCRPVTTANDTDNALARTDDQTLRIFDGSNIQESYPGITAPLTYSFIASAYGEVYKSFVRIMGVKEAVIEKNSPIFAGMLGYVDGHVYYNLASWYGLLAMLPAYKTNRPFMEGMMGLKDSAAAQIGAGEACEHGSRGNFLTRLSDWSATAASVICIVKNYLTMNGQIEDFKKRLNVLDFSVEGAGLSELAERYRLLQRHLLSHWQAPVCNDFFAMIFTGLLSKQVKDPQHYLRSGDVISALPPRLINELAELVAASGNLALLEALTGKNTAQALKILETEKQCWLKYQEYMSLFADRSINELKLESPSVKTDPSLLLATVGSLAALLIRERGQISEHDRPCGRVETHEDNEKAAVSLNGRITTWLAAKARLCLRRRENLRFERTRVFGAVRRIFLAMEEILVRERVLEEGDIFYLTVDEVLGFIEGSAVCIKPAALAAMRKKALSEYKQSCAERVTTRGAVGLGHHGSDISEAGQARGASPGIVRGLARLIIDADNETCRPGEIIIADHTDPGWIVHFASCAGIVVAHGSILSHTAIVAREMGIPAVVGMRDALTVIRNGDLIEINGSQGTVTILKPCVQELDVRSGAVLMQKGADSREGLKELACTA